MTEVINTMAKLRSAANQEKKQKAKEVIRISFVFIFHKALPNLDTNCSSGRTSVLIRCRRWITGNQGTQQKGNLICNGQPLYFSLALALWIIHHLFKNSAILVSAPAINPCTVSSLTCVLLES